MRLVTYYSLGVRVGVVVDSDVWDLRRCYELMLIELDGDPRAEDLARARIPSDMSAFALLNHGNLSALEEAVTRLTADANRRGWLTAQAITQPLEDVRLLAPVLRPSKIVNIGNSYRDHIVGSAATRGIPESEIEIPPDVKVSFFKTSSALTAPGDPVRYASTSRMWDFEGELAVVIGATCSRVSEDAALNHVFGYSVFNDASDRDVLEVLGGRSSPRGKSADTLAPMGPWIVTPDGLGADPNRLSLQVRVNDEVRQDSNTSQLLWPIEKIVAVTSRVMTLYPGDVIATGTPAGTGTEQARFLSEGDRVEVEIEGIGVLENPVGAPL